MTRSATSARRRVAIVFTRTFGADIGREKTMRAVRDALAATFDIEIYRLHSISETRRARDVVAALAVWLGSLLRLRPMALQCLLFATRSDCDALIRAISDGGFDTVYIDMVRSAYFLRKLREALPTIRVVTDLDDLISRRMEFAAQLRLPLSVGFAGRFLPSIVRKILEGVIPSTLVYRYEATCLRRAERDMAMASDAVVLVSDVERRLLAQRLPASGAGRIHAIVPPAAIRGNASPRRSPYRFVFVGSDTYLPNRLAIDFLLERWQAWRPDVPLHIYGLQKRPQPSVGGVVWHGFVDDIAEAYGSGSIALMPAFVPGGIKTKIVEAWAFGCPVLGNPEAFEGLCGPEYPLSVALPQWEAYLRAPENHVECWESAASWGQAIVRDRLSEYRFATSWCALIWPRTLSPAVAKG